MLVQPALALVACLAAALVQDVAEVSPSTSSEVRGLRVERKLHGATWLPTGSVGGRPLDALTPSWPWSHLVVEADLADRKQAKVVAGIVKGAAGLERRIAILIVDLGDRDADELEWLLWNEGWHLQPVAFATELDGPHASGEPSWRMVGAQPSFGFGAMPGAEPVDPIGGTLSGAKAFSAKKIFKAVDEGLEDLQSSMEQTMSRKYVEVALELDLQELEKASRKVEGATPGAGIVSGEPAAISLLVAVLRSGLPHLAAEAQLALRMGQPIDAERMVETIEWIYGADPKALAAIEELDRLGRGEDALAADRRLRKILGDELGRNQTRVREGLQAFGADAENPPAVVARARHYLALLDRFAPVEQD